MRLMTLLTRALFSKAPQEGDWQVVSLPHTWNAFDGQDGGADYSRGQFAYRLPLPEPSAGMRQYIQFEGANHIASVYVGETLLGVHEGGFSTFRFELTQAMAEGCRELTVLVDNRPSHVYPQQADFTFFGGLYRNVTFIEVPQAHIDLMRRGSSGVFVTPQAGGEIRVDVFLDGIQDGDQAVCRIVDPSGKDALLLTVPAAEHTVLEGKIPAPRLWDGREDPACYTARLELVRDGEVLDNVETVFGFRSFSVDPDRGFFLNGRSYPLRGVSRHQDRLDKGWAISRADHEEDLSLIEEVGANSIRLAHYQHDAYFYDLCDRAGMVLWAEIPFISLFMEGQKARENTVSQMTELIAQNYNHPSICFWGISNEITIGGESAPLLDNLRELNDLVHRLDPSRLSTMAQVTMLPMESPQNQLTDVLSYNHYFGWYIGSVDQNGPWFDAFHAKYPQRCIGVSEYGAEAVLGWHSSEPKVRDYTEEYQAVYHQAMLEMFDARPYLWSTYVWNMFDFAADARDEGGSRGRNNKGLVTYDRKLKKDAFFVYKAWWSREPFVYIAGRRFVNRAPGQRTITVYSNQKSVTLLVNGKEIGTQHGEHVFVFPEVPFAEGHNTITAKSGSLEDTAILRAVEEPDPEYVLPDQNPGAEGVTNWFADIQVHGELEFPEGYFSIRDSVKSIADNPEGAKLLEEYGSALFGTMAKSLRNMMGMMGSMQLDQAIQLAGSKLDEKGILYINQMLNKIPKNS